MKKRIKKILLKKNFYYKLKYSSLFRIYLHLFKPLEIKKEKREVDFYKSFLPSCKLIFDIGAHDGHKTEAFLKIADRVICCEPDKENFIVLQNRFRHKQKRVFLENKAVAEDQGNSNFYVHHNGSAFNTLSAEWKKTLENDNMVKWSEKIEFREVKSVETINLDFLIKKYGKPDFIKIDVEGYEEHVLKGLSEPVPFLSFEALLPEGAEDLSKCVEKINTLDAFTSYNIAVNEKLILNSFVNRQHLIDFLQKHNLQHLEIITKKS